MANDSRQVRLDTATQAVLAAEGGLADMLARHRNVLAEHPVADSTVARVQTNLAAHLASLRDYLGGHEASAVPPHPGAPESMLLNPQALGEQPRATAVLHAAASIAGHAALGYGRLYALALSLYEPPLRKICPAHMKDCTGVVRQLGALLADVTAWELGREGLVCQCICPMCGIGACGCVALAGATLHRSWQPEPDAGQPPGFALQAPRPESQLAGAGVQAGDRLLAVDGTPVSSIPEIQAALRRHALGEAVVLGVQREPERVTEVRVSHVSDYPAP